MPQTRTGGDEPLLASAFVVGCEQVIPLSRCVRGVSREEESLLEKLVAPFSSVWSHLKEVMGLRDRSEPTIEDFRLELAELGLLGRAFGPEAYRKALEKHLGMEILVEELPDTKGGALAGQLAGEGILAEVVVNEESGNAVVLVRESLRYRPWPAYELAIFHELSHLAAGHPLRMIWTPKNGETRSLFRSLGSPEPIRGEPAAPSDGADLEELKRNALEIEARKRAKWLVVAGTAPEAFEAETANRLI